MVFTQQIMVSKSALAWYLNNTANYPINKSPKILVSQLLRRLDISIIYNFVYSAYFFPVLNWNFIFAVCTNSKTCGKKKVYHMSCHLYSVCIINSTLLTTVLTSNTADLCTLKPYFTLNEHNYRKYISFSLL